jgi:hypothetical protein
MGMAARLHSWLVVMMAIVVGSSGCSWIFMKRAPDKRGPEPVVCSSDHSAPIGDLFVASLFAVVSAALIESLSQACENHEGPQCSDDVDAAPYLGAMVAAPGLPYLASGLTGLWWTSTCRATKRQPWPPPVAPVRPIVPLPPELACDLLEIEAARGDAPVVDPKLAPLADELAPKGSWNRLRVVLRSSRRVRQGRPVPVDLTVGSATFTVAVSAESRIRSELKIDGAGADAFPPVTVDIGRYAIQGPRAFGNRMRMFALSCRLAIEGPP